MKKIILNSIILFLFVASAQAQKKDSKTEEEYANSSVKVKLKNLNYVQDSINKPKVYVNGKIFDFELSLIDPNRIESMSVIKGDEAIANYDAPQGVILIKTKTVKDTIILQSEKNEFKIKGFGKEEIKEPIFFVDGKQVDNNTIKALSPDDIESIKVLKNETAKALYNAENGVVIIKTKKVKNRISHKCI